MLEPGRGEDAVPSAARVEDCMPDAGGRGRAAAPASGRGGPCRDSSGAMMPGKGSSRFGGFVANMLIMSDYFVRLAPVCRPDIIAWHIIF